MMHYSIRVIELMAHGGKPLSYLFVARVVAMEGVRIFDGLEEAEG